MNHTFFLAPKFLSGAGELSEGLIATMSQMDHTEKAKNYFSEFQSKYTIKAAPSFIILEKEGISLILDAIKAGNYTSADIKKYFDTITETNKRDGYFGPYYFDENGDAVGLKFIIQQIQSGQVVPIE